MFSFGSSTNCYYYNTSLHNDPKLDVRQHLGCFCPQDALNVAISEAEAGGWQLRSIRQKYWKSILQCKWRRDKMQKKD